MIEEALLLEKLLELRELRLHTSLLDGLRLGGYNPNSSGT
jgi:hypothetical protein